MRKAELEVNSKEPNFIGAWHIQPTTICDDLVEYFNKNEKRQKEGVTDTGRNIEIKSSTDITIQPAELAMAGGELFSDYVDCLISCYKDYLVDWPFIQTFAKQINMSSFNLQRYSKGQHFKRLHCERSSISTAHRVFAWMTYLNDVDDKDGGSTVFEHYNLEVKPTKGLTLIWPAEWTHAHYGNAMKSGSKYIITGWLHMPV